MKLSFLLKSSSILLALGTFTNATNAQLYSSGNNTIAGNAVGIGVSNPQGTLHLNDFTGGFLGGGEVPLMRFESTDLGQSPTTTNYWDFTMGLSSSLVMSRFSTQNSNPVDALQLGAGYVKVFERFKVTDYAQMGSAITPNNTQGYVLSLGMLEGNSGSWNGSGTALFGTNTGEFQVMTNPTGSVIGTTNMANQVRFTANESGITVRKDPSKTFVDLSFIDPAQTGTDKRAFTIRTVGANHATSPNILEFWDPHNNGQAFFTMPIRIGGPASDISVTASGYDLYVKGGVRATTVKVDAYVNWPDYVFAPSYDLMSLKETEQFIDQNSHLPGVPSEAEVQKEGIELAEMNAILLKKVEELTLHLIELQKQVNQLQNDQ